ncbi:MAG TPA: hypothetical protein VF553_15960 [Pyrinomonadaceae bacterium]|jgi:hypothetical protein
MRAILLRLTLLFCASTVCAQESFRLPNKTERPVVSYLKEMKVRDTSRQLSDEEKHQLCRLFVKAFIIARRQQQQDYLINADAPIYRLLVTNFPGLKARAGADGIFLGDITSFFNASAQYRPDVLALLRQGIDKKYCKE